MEMDNRCIDFGGFILRIELRNFFCHNNFEINFNKRVSYLVGCNGRGKSAFITALVMGLGGKAASTGRGGSFSTFIKRGADSASVSIKINNSSSTAYKYDVYGDSITIVHEFNRTGTSIYKVKSHTGALVSTKFQEVQRITVAHNIQVDNPISVLNQQESENFFCRDPKSLYTFFRKATNFDKTEKNYFEALDLCEKAENKWQEKKDLAKKLEAENKKWKALYDSMLSRLELEKQKKALENEYYWAVVAELERDLSSASERQQRYNEREAQVLADRDSLTSRAASQLQSVTEELEAAEAVRADAERELEAAQGARREAEAAAKLRREAVRRLHEERARELGNLQHLRAEIDNMTSGASETVRAELEESARACEAAYEEARARLATATHTANQARQAMARTRDQLDEAADKLQRARADTETARGSLRVIQRAGADALAVFGPLMVELRRRVDAAVSRGVFSKPPRGPVGAYIKLRDPQCGSALEHILGSAVTTFCVNNDTDVRTLFSIIGEVYRGRDKKPSVSCSEFSEAMYNVSGKQACAPGTVAALDAVRISDPVIANYLIDNLDFAKLVLAPDDEVSMRLTSEERNVPPNLRRVVTLDCAEFYPAPNYRSYGGRAAPVRYLHQDVADRVRQVQSEVASCEQLEATAARAAEAMAAKRRAAVAALHEEDRALSALRAAATEAEARFEAARDALRHHAPPSHQALAEEVRALEERLADVDAQLQPEGPGEGGDGEAAAELRARVQAATNQLRTAKQQYRALQERVHEEQLQVESARARAAVLEQRLGSVRAECKRANAAVNKKRAELDRKREAALLLCERIESPRNSVEVARLVNQARARLRAGLGTTLSRAAVSDRLAAALRRNNEVQNELRHTRMLIDQTQEVAQVHLRRCQQLQTTIVRSVQVSFQCLLKLRHYTGAIEVNKGTGELNVVCTPNQQTVRGADSMSGGERSYATVAFFMALWECVELPFCFLDEFDVFMDQFNRSTSLKLLEAHALRNPGRQYVFITPQMDCTITANDLISIFM